MHHASVEDRLMYPNGILRSPWIERSAGEYHLPPGSQHSELYARPNSARLRGLPGAAVVAPALGP